MSFLKKLRRKVGGRQSKHVGGADEDIQEGANETTIQKAQEHATTSVDDPSREVVPQAEKGVSTGQTVNISGGTFTEIQNQNNIQYVMSDESESKLFATLNPVAAAHDCQEVASKITECFAGTRRQLLLDIENWRANESSVPIFILDGIAGIGKTTVVKTFCTRAAAELRLAASWFFSRDQQDRKSTRGFVGTLAFQLASYHPALRDRIAQVLKDQPDILQKTIRAQFSTLIHEPLQAVLQELEGTHSVSIDAIDECDLDEATEILSILLGTVPKHPQLRLLITCRPERPFRLLLQKHQGPHVFHLHEIENSVVESDIRLYINYRLSPEEVDEALPDLLPPPWRASAKEKEALVQMAGKLFIIASTAVNFILDPKRLAPARQMRQLLDAATGSALASSPMDRLYTQVLRAAVPDPVDDWFDDYQAVVGAIVVAADVLPIQSLASLLDKEPNDIVGTLSHLHSLVAPTSHNEAFRVHHKSFPDFVTDSSRCSIDTRFLIDASAAHFHLARDCLRVMVQMLKQNICDLPISDWSKEINELPPGTVDRIPPELAYACTHWISHFQQGLSHFNGSKDSLLVDRLNAFVNEHLLSWLEVMALKDRFRTAWNSVNVLSEAISTLLQTATGPTWKVLSQVVDALQDCLRFITFHPNLPRLCPMHLYLSSLAFAPSGSMTHNLYAKCLPTESITVISGIDNSWGPLPVAFGRDVGTVDASFSPCGKMIATMNEHLGLYNVKTGGQVVAFNYPEGVGVGRWFGRIVFSPDGQLVAVGTRTGACIWHVASHELIAEFPMPQLPTKSFDVREEYEGDGESEDKDEGESEDEEPQMSSITFTGDGTSIVAGRDDGIVFLWTLEGDSLPQHVFRTSKPNKSCTCGTGRIHKTCNAHYIDDIITLPGPSPTILVTGSEVQFWDLSSPALLNTIPRHVDESHFTCPVSLSLEKTKLAIECAPCAINVYSTSQISCIAVLSGHQGLITTMAFALEPDELCSASDDMTVRIWNITTSTQLRIIPTTPSILTDAVFATSVEKFIFQSEDRMVMVTDNQCTAFGPAVRQDRGQTFITDFIRLSSNASNLAIFSGTYTIFSGLKDLIESPSFDFLDFPYRMGFFPTGQLVTVCNTRQGFIEVVISNSSGSAQELGATSFKLMSMDVDPDAPFVTSPDMSRVAVTGPSSSVMIYNLYSQRLEAFLEPIPGAAKREPPSIGFSWDSQAVYVERKDSELSYGFYAAVLQPAIDRSQTCDHKTVSTIQFSKYDMCPNPHWSHLVATTALPGPQPHLLSLSGHNAWVSHQPHPILTMAYSPNGSLVAMRGIHGKDYNAPRTIQLRRLPDYGLIGSVRDLEDLYETRIQFLPSLPHILVAHSATSFASWDTSTFEAVGEHKFSDPSISLRHIHPYNASDFLCLIRKNTIETMIGLAAIRLRGSLPATVYHICWFPPHLSIGDWCLEVNPCHPHIIALSGRSAVLQVDISKVPLPFTL
ncbi:hypothetical protein BKA70DRAFT_1577118 [Coprinopsis sp. MPI-PUGE-AT-0042]|nr:hypothetical protein BKA70DRAFT_1577118 [Coprinopsis sp. MPI-PUGE-AT-0042]